MNAGADSGGAQARAAILSRVRSALRDVPGDEPVEGGIVRDYRTAHIAPDPDAMTDLLAENLVDYRASVHRCREDELAQRIADLLRERGSTSFTAPAGLPAPWLAQCSALAHVADAAGANALSARELDGVDSVVTGCAIAILALIAWLGTLEPTAG